MTTPQHGNCISQKAKKMLDIHGDPFLTRGWGLRMRLRACVQRTDMMAGQCITLNIVVSIKRILILSISPNRYGSGGNN